MTNLPPFREAEFRKSSYSDPDRDCVQVARRTTWVAVRDSKTDFNATDDCQLVLSAEMFDLFLARHRK